MYTSNSFPLDPSIIYLNHAAVAPWPQSTSDRVQAFAAENCQFGATHYPAWLKLEAQLRSRLATLIGAPSSRNIALQKSTSEGLSVIAYGLPWQAGDEVIIGQQEFPSNRIVWESLQSLGVKVVDVDLNVADPEQALIAAISAKTRLMAISSVQYGTGLTLDLPLLGDACHDHDVLFCVDAIQSLGVIPFDVSQCRAHFVVADGHKWMLGPEGTALLYVCDEWLTQLKIHQYGWHMIEQRGNYDTKEWTLAEDARRYECGSPNMMGIVALNTSLELLLEVGISAVNAQLMERVEALQQALMARADLELVTNTQRPLRSGILTFKHKQLATQELQTTLMKLGVICAARGGGVRFSPHFYTPLEKLSEAVALIPKA